MAWSWSHTDEAYANAEANVRAKDIEWLRVCFAEWRACPNPDEDSNEFDQTLYTEAMDGADKATADDLADYIWERMSEFATCDNGGFNAYACPSGCHTVSFDLKTEEEEE